MATETALGIMQDIFLTHRCVMCEEEGARVKMFNEARIHKACHSLIIQSMGGLLRKISNLFPNAVTRAFAYQKALIAMRQKTEGRTLKQYYEQEGKEAFTRLCNKTGTEAIQQFAQDMRGGRPFCGSNWDLSGRPPQY